MHGSFTVVAEIVFPPEALDMRGNFTLTFCDTLEHTQTPKDHGKPVSEFWL